MPSSPGKASRRETFAHTFAALAQRFGPQSTAVHGAFNRWKATWPIVAPSFYPNEGALQAAEQDVLQPWAAATSLAFTKVFGKETAKVWWIPLTTPLDGDFRINATIASGGSADVALVGAARRTVVRRAQWVGQRLKRLDSSICGRRSLFLRVTQKGPLGRVRVSVTTP